MGCDTTCEEGYGGILGIHGVCNNQTNTCMCPEGYSGVDLWYKANDCHGEFRV